MGNSASASRVDTRSNPLGSVSLGVQERAVLAVLLSNVGRVVSRRELSRQAGVAMASLPEALTALLPTLVDRLTPDGEVPDPYELLRMAVGFLRGERA